MDQEKLERAVRAFVEALGLDPGEGELRETPARVARAWAEDLASGYGRDAETELTWSPVPAGGALVVVREVRFASICIHHLLPFFGAAQVAYLPGQRLAGLSKIGRVVDILSRRLRTQEQLTDAILGTFERVLEPRGVLVLLRARHTCMTLRGVRKEQSEMLTLGTAGVYRTDEAARRDVLALLSG